MKIGVFGRFSDPEEEDGGDSDFPDFQIFIMF